MKEKANIDVTKQPTKIKSSPKLSPITKLSYGVGHVYNDLCASMWFTYLLVFFQQVSKVFVSTNS